MGDTPTYAFEREGLAASCDWFLDLGLQWSTLWLWGLPLPLRLPL